MLHAPQTLRALVRADEVWLAVLAASVGALAGVGVALMNLAINIMHERLFDLAPGQGLSASTHIEPLRVLPGAGAGRRSCSAFSGWRSARFRPRN